jgi:phosphoribosylaminoimidazole-succinocarboxamide synthase
MNTLDLVKQNLTKTVNQIDLDLPLFTRGKVRDIFEVETDKLLLVVSDRVSVFDRVVGTIPFKGQILNSIANWWMEKVEDIIPHHLISVPHPSSSIVKKLKPLPVEVIVRGFLTGNSPTSIWTIYNRGQRTYCGNILPDGMTRHQPLNPILITPTTKAEVGGHDQPITAQEIISQGLVEENLWKQVEKTALALFARGQKEAESKGLILADTKYEFGVDDAGKLHLIDEVNTPDSSRYWYGEDYEERVKNNQSPRGLDKDFVRNHMKSLGYVGEGEIPALSDEIRVQASMKYIALYELLTGTKFVPNQEEIQTSITRSLK